jgi:PAS domain S-box-containing protein
VFDRQEVQRAVSEEVFRQISAAMVIVEAPSGKILFVNRQTQKWTQEYIGQSIPSELRYLGDFQDVDENGISRIRHPDGRPYEMSEWPLMRSITSGEEVRDWEYLYTLADGTHLWFRANSSPIYDEVGRIVAGVLLTHDFTEQKQAEQELREREERFRATFEQAAVGIAHTALDGRWLRVNHKLCDILGYTREELLEKTFEEITYPDDLEPTLGYRRQLLAGEIGSFSMEKRYIRKDGSIVWGNLTASLGREPSGEPDYVIHVIEDITDRKRTEEELKEASREIEDILERITDEFFALDREWRFTYINERGLASIQRAKGESLTREDLLGRTLWEVFPEIVDAPPYQELHRALHEQKRVEFEAYAPVTDRWLEVHAYPSEEGLSAYMQDITERKRVEKEMETRTHQQAVVAELGLWALASNDLQALMDDTATFVAQTLDVEYCKIVELLPGGEKLLLRAGVGWEEGLVGNVKEEAGLGSQSGYTLHLRAPVIMEDLGAEMRFTPPPLLREHGVVSGMTVVIAGRERPFGVLGAHTQSLRTFSEDDVNFLQAVANVLAMAIERKETEERLEEVREAVRSRIARDLHDQALQYLAHAKSLAHLARTNLGDPELAGWLSQLSASLRRVEQQVRAAIYDLRLEEEQDRPFSELLVSLIELHRTMAPDCDIRLDMGGGILSGPLGAAGTELLRIIGEALTNARRHSGARNVRVAVGASEEKLWAEVSDDGRGFDPVEEPSTLTAGMGTRDLRERAYALGGTLKIESQTGKGTKVRIALALGRDGKVPKDEVRVLLVEDHAAVREAIASTLEREAGFRVVGQAGSLAEARSMLGTQPVDVAIIDLGLPDGYGADLVPELKEASPQAQALVLSADLDRAQIARAVHNGAAGILDKTAHLDQVADSIRRLIRGETLLPPEEVVELLRFASTRLEEEYDARQAIARLTSREIEVLQYLANGLDSEEIAQRLHISLRTERNHVSHILTKLGVHSQLQALVFAIKYGVVKIH